ALRRRLGERLVRLSLRIRYAALGCAPELEPGGHPERLRLGAQHGDARGDRETRAASSAHYQAQTGDVSEPSHGADGDAAADGARGAGELAQATGGAPGGAAGLRPPKSYGPSVPLS